MKVTCMFLFLTTLSGCTALTGAVTGGVLDSITGQDTGLSVDTEIVAGDKAQSVGNSGADTKLEDVTVRDNAQINNVTTGENMDISGAESVTLNNGVPFWQAGLGILLGICIGMFLPQVAIRRK